MSVVPHANMQNKKLRPHIKRQNERMHVCRLHTETQHQHNNGGTRDQEAGNEQDIVNTSWESVNKYPPGIGNVGLR